MITVNNVTKSYNGELVLKGVSLEILDGEFVSIMGESGSGKSTLLGIIGGYLARDGGEVLLDGRDISALSDKELSHLRCTELGFVFQSYRLIPTLNVKDNLLLPATLAKNTGKETQIHLDHLTETLRLSDLLKKFPDQLSGGQAQRVAIARALLYKPKTLILDEPTGALDSETEGIVMRLLCEVNQTLGTTVVQVTHSKSVAEYGSRIVFLKDGKIVK